MAVAISTTPAIQWIVTQAGISSGGTPLYLAPQAGVSESPFRRLCRAFGADVVVSEFVSSEGIRRHDRRTHEYLRFEDEERPIGIQIYSQQVRDVGGYETTFSATSFLGQVYPE